jgi:hypothetical protein
MRPANPLMDPPALPPRIAEFRKNYRKNSIGRFYNGAAHLSFVVVGCLAVIAITVSQVDQITPWEWLTIPLTFFFANIVEFYGHRGPMHRKFRGLGLVFHRHVLEHHQFFTDQWMTCRSFKDFKIVLFPPLHLFLYLGVVAFPLGALFYFLVTHNVGWILVGTVMFYFMQYEILHFCYHLDGNSWAAKLPVISMLRRHHQTHHNLALMDRYNFNITWPIADVLFGTLHHAPMESIGELGRRVV